MRCKQNIKSFIIPIVVLCMSIFCNCRTGNSTFVINEFKKVRCGTEGKDINFVELTKDEDLGENLIIFFDKYYKVINYIKAERVNSFTPYYLSSNYLVLGEFRDELEGGRKLVVYEYRSNSITSIKIKYHYIDNLFIYNDFLFFSSEMANPHLNAINLRTKEEYHCDDYYCPSAKFGAINDKVYAQYKDKFYVFESSIFKPVSESVKLLFEDNNSEENLSISEDLLQKLKF